MSTPRKSHEDVGPHFVGLKTTRGVFRALSVAEIDDHSHSVFKGDKGFKSINDSECYHSP
jgi:hypothetical protein